MVLIHGYETVRVRFWGRHKIRHCDVCAIPESIIIKTSPSNVSIGSILDARENERFKIFSTLLLVRTLPFAIIKFKHPFLIHQHLPGPSREGATLAFQAWISWQMLMHRKSCLIPILQGRKSVILY